MNRNLFTTPRSFALSVVLFWVLFTALVMSIGWLSIELRGKGNLPATFVWNIGWLLWAVETFLVVAIARSLPLEKGRLVRRIVLHVFAGLLVAFLHVQIESVLQDWLEPVVRDGRPGRSSFEALFFYKFYVFYLIYWTIVGATNAFDYHNRFRAEEVESARLGKELAESQLQALKTQVHPHFLFNTHHSIIALMLQGRNQTAVQMLTRLSDLLRLTLENQHRQTAALGEELEALRLYISIQEQRFGDRVKFAVEIPAELNEAEIPYLILQPLVENAITHGLDADAAQAEILVRGRREADQLVVEVLDPGCTVSSKPPLAKSHGIGLVNTNQRLQRLYGSAALFELVPRPERGMIARVCIPWCIYQPDTAFEPNGKEDR